METISIGVSHPFVFGGIAVYAVNLYAARQVYEDVRQMAQVNSFGSVQLETGEQVRWVDMRARAHHRDMNPPYGVTQVACRPVSPSHWQTSSSGSR